MNFKIIKPLRAAKDAKLFRVKLWGWLPAKMTVSTRVKGTVTRVIKWCGIKVYSDFRFITYGFDKHNPGKSRKQYVLPVKRNKK